MAYVLGYWFADGNMYYQSGAGGYFVSIGSKDVAHLDALRLVIGAGTLTRITGSDVFKLVICRKEMFDDLLLLGGTERKSLILAWPEVPDEFLADFVRGYINGDGCLSWNKTSSSVQPMLDGAGTKEFITGLAMATQVATGIPAPTCHFHSEINNTWRMMWYGMSAKCFAVWLYDYNVGLCLARKKAIASQFQTWHPHKFFPHRVTAKMWALFGPYLP